MASPYERLRGGFAHDRTSSSWRASQSRAVGSSDIETGDNGRRQTLRCDRGLGRLGRPSGSSCWGCRSGDTGVYRYASHEADRLPEVPQLWVREAHAARADPVRADTPGAGLYLLQAHLADGVADPRSSVGRHRASECRSGLRVRRASLRQPPPRPSGDPDHDHPSEPSIEHVGPLPMWVRDAPLDHGALFLGSAGREDSGETTPDDYPARGLGR